MRALVLLVVLINAASATAQSPAPADSSSTGETSVPTVSADALLAGVAERFGSAIQISYGLSDVADLRVDPDFPESPDDTLWRWTTTFKLSSLFTTTADLKAAYGSLAKYKDATGAAAISNSLAQRTTDDWVRYFRRTRVRDRFGRFLSAFSLSASKSEREESAFGPMGRNGLGDATKWTWDATFDPAVLFTSAEQKADAYTALSSFLTLFPDARTSGGADSTLNESLRSLGGLSTGKAIVASLIPVVKLESIDQFDYAMIGGQPVLFPVGQDGALQNITLTWNLLKILRPTQAKAAALAALKARDELRKTIKTLENGLTVSDMRVCASPGSYIAYPLTAAGDGLAWKKAGDSWEGKQLHLTSEGVLVGHVDCGGRPSCDMTLGVTVKDAVGREKTASVVIVAEVTGPGTTTPRCK